MPTNCRTPSTPVAMPARTSTTPGASLRASTSFMPIRRLARSPGGTTCAPKTPVGMAGAEWQVPPRRASTSNQGDRMTPRFAADTRRAQACGRYRGDLPLAYLLDLELELQHRTGLEGLDPQRARGEAVDP